MQPVDDPQLLQNVFSSRRKLEALFLQSLDMSAESLVEVDDRELPLTLTFLLLQVAQLIGKAYLS